MIDLNLLNDRQREAATHGLGPLLIFAGAGSGKTRALTYRMAWLIENGVAPYNILAITFTNKAAREMKERVKALHEEGGQIWVSTFHSACVRILRREIQHIGYGNQFTILDAEDSEKVIVRCMSELKLDTRYFSPKAFAKEISGIKDHLKSPEEFAAKPNRFPGPAISKVYASYQKKLMDSNNLDFDDLIFLVVKLFTTRTDILEKYQDRFHYIMVDEYQDTSVSQYKLISLLASKYGNICVVGDDDQSIYSWRGADIRNILSFEKDFPGAHVVKLEQNYRSTQTILKAANMVIANNSRRMPKQLWTENEKGALIKRLIAPNDMDEAAFVVDIILDGVKNGGKFSDYAVLYRINAQSRSIETECSTRGVPHRLIGGVRFFQRQEIKDVLAYLKALQNPRDDVSYMRIINTPKRGIGETTVKSIAEFASANEMPFSQALAEADQYSRNKGIAGFIQLMQHLSDFAKENIVAEIVLEVLEKSELELNLKKDDTEEAKSRLENISSFVSMAAEFSSREADESEKTLGAFLEGVSLVADVDSYKQEEDAVVLMTLHNAKGLEFSKVFMVGVEDGLFPGNQTIMTGDLEEERRLFYVGITRARKELYLSTAKERRFRESIQANSPSRFLKEISADIVETKRKRSQASAAKSRPDQRSAARPKSNNFLPTPKGWTLGFGVGDEVFQCKFGFGFVESITPAGADYEVTVNFSKAGKRKVMAKLSNLIKAIK
ncbi:MAG: UvrD-helicase domain-containing protein [Clostridiales bacterium]|jgi:DNA helicase-2/ATP-dependent DNA helicase PcrA|nr:UvrD-helicase domain-containing protein [Clostridiales bacterium]